MRNPHLLVVAMAEKCRGLLQRSERTDHDLPQSLHPRHLLWMCNQIEEHADDWPETKLHRWIGFIQCGMVANQVLDFEEAITMFDEAKTAYGVSGADQDLIDHLDPTVSFELDMGGEV